ncbi:AraC family transcriptional regulator [uncultured Acetatifactor sp.]|uniref:AraC family transcriptional regulator n=1 Tax=uncultured Acetatifactor sp. TaxID=1671927 RepID=UPI0026054ED8|nr:AraC family transcriptional regulator [uncultured Acetatifactor sp.]
MDKTEKDIFRLEKCGGVDGPLQFDDFNIFQICDIQTAVGSTCLPHIQVCDEISYVASGYCRHTVNNRELELGPGDLLLLQEGDIHAYSTDQKQPARIWNLGIVMKKHENIDLTDIWSELHTHSGPLLLHEAVQIEKIFVSLFEEIAGGNAYWEYALQLYTEQLLLTLCRILRRIRVRAYTPQSSEESQKRLLYSIINYMDAHVEEMNALKDMCDIFHYSYAYISHFFKKMMGTSVSAYYQQRRFSHAAELLMQEKYSITEISARMGYQTVHAFSKAFTKFYGMCPTQYLHIKHQNSEEYIV